MRSRLLVAALSLLCTTACASPASDTAATTTAPTTAAPTTQPESLALVIEPSTDDVAEAVTLPSMPADLPPDLVDRLALMTGWLTGFEPAMNSGYEPVVAQDGEAIEAHFLVRTADRTEAEGLCDLYTEVVDHFAGERPTDAAVTLSGWVPSGDGVYVDAGWDDIRCQG